MGARTNGANYLPRAGELVRDNRSGRKGIYMDTQGGQYYLRPERGGREWTVDPAQVAPVPDGTDLSARPAARDQASRPNEGRVG
ncbi:hypothetical protein [Kitasatospora sp. NPDC050543]|uniref:hypothetical protein n=1 Tax=Kitasatospora sp. NPDC050543 TaxID=3364054 RepID=UPI00378C5E13